MAAVMEHVRTAEAEVARVVSAAWDTYVGVLKTATFMVESKECEQYAATVRDTASELVLSLVAVREFVAEASRLGEYDEFPVDLMFLIESLDRGMRLLSAIELASDFAIVMPRLMTQVELSALATDEVRGWLRQHAPHSPAPSCLCS